MTFRIHELSCRRNHHDLFGKLSFTVNEGEAVLIEGANGSGKSSLLRMLAGLSTPVEGDIFWQNKNIQDDLEAFYNDRHYLGHLNGIKLGLTVRENLTFAAMLCDYPSMSSMDEVLETLQLTSYVNTPAKQLSAGQKRKLALAKLWLIPKKLWLLDEPLTALDQTTESLVVTRINAHLKNNGMVIASAHHPILLNAQTQIVRLPV